MIVDQSHRGWFIGSLIVLALGVLLYVPYALRSVSGPSGGSIAGLTYAGIGSAMMVFAGFLGVRKKYRILRVGRATLWMRGHLWIGFLSFPFILLHAGFRLGSGALTKVLMALFLVVFVSGVFGAVLQHFMPQVMTERVPMETVYDQIDHVLAQLIKEASLIVADIGAALERELEREEAAKELLPVPAKPKAATRVLVDERVSKKVTRFFDVQMKPYLESRHFRKHLLANPTQAATAFRELKILVPPNLGTKIDDLENICEEKRELEHQRLLHKLLHGWLLFHIPASYALLLLGAIHAVVALRY